MNRSSSDSPRNGARRALWLIFGLALIILLPFAANSFISDDWDLIWRVSSQGPFAIWTFHPNNFFRPLISLSLWCNFGIGSWQSWAYYVPNFILHAANTAFVFQIARKLLQRTNPELLPASNSSVAAVAALLFMAAPVHAEAIFFMCCRTDLQAAFFGLSSILVFLIALEKKLLPLGLLSGALLAIGYFSKESVYLVFAFPLVMGYLERKDRERARIAWIVGAAAFVVLAVTVSIRSQVVVGGLPHLSPTQMLVRIATTLIAPNVPLDVAVATGRSVPHLAALDWAALLGLLVLAGFAARHLLRQESGAVKAPDLRAPLAAYILTVLPVCIFAMPPLALEGGRLTYLPSAFAVMSFAFLLAPYLSRAAVRAGIVTLVLVGVLFTYFNGTLYRDAGRACDTTVDWFRTQRPGSSEAMILVPDSIAGKYIWRNGLPGALSAFAPDWAKVPQVVALYLKPSEVSAMMQAGKFDIGTIKTSNVLRYGVAESVTRLSKVSLIVVRVNGSVDRIDGVDFQLSPAR